ncbi:MAG TPA: hypothetical protein VGJ60_10190 [Chloroflexota bacterium]|jgi:hypothetical protein
MQSDRSSVRALADAQLERLDADLRVLSPVGIERAAWGWDRHENRPPDEFRAAERAALHAIEAAGEGEAWDAWRRRLFEEVEEGGPRPALIAWRSEHQAHSEHVHKAERAALGAALGLFAQALISHAKYAKLVSAMAEALPWLLPERPPAPAHA